MVNSNHELMSPGGQNFTEWPVLYNNIEFGSNEELKF